ERVGCRALGSADELVADPEVDAVVVATPDDLHASIAVAAARAGKAVLVEKPLTTSAQDARAVVEAVREAGVVASVLFNHRWVPAYAQAHERVRAGDLGDPVVAYARKNDRIFVPTKMIDWADRTTPAWFLSSHDIDLVTWLFADLPVEVFATAVTGKLRGLGIDTPDAIQAQVRYAGGAVATFEACWVYPDTFPTMVDSFVEVVGTDGVIHLDRKVEQIEIATTDGFSYPRNLLQRTVHGVSAGAVRDCLWHFVDCVATGAEPLVTIESAATTTAVLEALHASTRTGRPQRVAAFAESPRARV
ncbi:Gfo/Idh/MocA family protein, partial [Actinophytocola sp.]|uniref:Gfo/Idh/MocA family protein n=1 Tax=Actinophytocola sp. TaxID=1872138 RepID=UPI003D6B7E95